MPPPTTTTSNSSSDSAARAWLRSITTAVSQSWSSDLGELRCDLGHGGLRVAEQHRRLRVVVELVFDACETRVHRALDDAHREAVRDLEDRHPVDRRAGG